MTDSATDVTGQITSSESEAFANILQWSEGQPSWQRDALRRLYNKDTLDATDLDELTELCQNPDKEGIPLSSEHVPHFNLDLKTVQLKAICNVENVNALKSGECLSFCKKGLTVIYGQNGSGKSGYARILKKVCRARTPESEKEILPNIYKQSSEPSRATIDFVADKQHKSINWNAQNKQSSNPLLLSISIFDSGTANVHVGKANNIAYTPFPMRILEQLADTCQRIQKLIEQKISNLDQQTPEIIKNPNCNIQTKVGKLIAKLNDDIVDKTDVCNLAKLDIMEKAKLEKLKRDLATNHRKSAIQLKAQKQRFDDATRRLRALHKAVTEEQVSHLTELHQNYKIARDAATAAAKTIFNNDLLPNIGSEVWRSLWEAARDYSEKHAYPGKVFPFTGDSARCVLCQQELDTESANRLNRFENFIKDTTKRKEKEAETAYINAQNILRNVNVSIQDLQRIISLIHDELNDENLAQLVRRSAVTAKWRLRAIRRLCMCDNDIILPVADNWPEELVTNQSSSLSQRVDALQIEEHSEQRQQMHTELGELKDREWLASVQDDVIAEIDRKKKRAALKTMLNDTQTRSITLKSSNIAERLVTKALCTQFSEEIEKLSATQLKIGIQKKNSHRGVPMFQVTLSHKHKKATTDKILSEGEYRCAALAAFLAEIATTKNQSAIVFDDPVSSLDQINLETVATRLAEEAQHRQVIVFTHDIAFLFLLDQACRDKKTHIGFRSVARNHDYAGLIQQDLPVRAQPIEKILDSMQNQLNNEKRSYENGQYDKWEITVDAIQKRLRSTWERAVEEVIGPVLKRLSSKVETQGLIKLTILDRKDCEQMRKAYGRCSEGLHTTALTLNPLPPKPEDIQKEITELRNWISNIQKRQREIR
ncbi:MAG: hypothetical protein TQ37_08705 [Candidatus Synechococcus spongiarum 15L]|uniref:Protein CR006 P-loop domain-containing protein n=1 Tax=Candidatus Synechococcus spongiarum 15L TaxID=1608419 RepID=A0A0G8ARV7_9SYNE|nr:MAG: hypothetical protein TQ37_08705 [Candidatus Synechococcus spongiarum 15L]